MYPSTKYSTRIGETAIKYTKKDDNDFDILIYDDIFKKLSGNTLVHPVYYWLLHQSARYYPDYVVSYSVLETMNGLV